VPAGRGFLRASRKINHTKMQHLSRILTMVKDRNPRSTSDILDVSYAVLIVRSPDRFFIVKRHTSTRNVVELETRSVEGKVARFLVATDVFNLDVERGWFPVLKSQK
jgi:hypothetical protein